MIGGLRLLPQTVQAFATPLVSLIRTRSVKEGDLKQLIQVTLRVGLAVAILFAATHITPFAIVLFPLCSFPAMMMAIGFLSLKWAITSLVHIVALEHFFTFGVCLGGWLLLEFAPRSYGRGLLERLINYGANHLTQAIMSRLPVTTPPPATAQTITNTIYQK